MRGHLILTSVTPENQICAIKTQKRKARFLSPQMETFSTPKGEFEFLRPGSTEQSCENWSIRHGSGDGDHGD